MQAKNSTTYIRLALHIPKNAYKYQIFKLLLIQNGARKTGPPSRRPTWA